ncbi:TorF family putative porin [Pseudomonas sp. sp1636]|uniref:TorF family putative porin n=1 Tax=Pseudomonas sp. sp1636 TaxID=3036707 RepID=UPI0025A5ADC6|nr:TorF family putative porin [Pseudomonas sp. sp1636]MDM8349034.1 TorF family putative porin [Pseudomonas sp. sp1636]
MRALTAFVMAALGLAPLGQLQALELNQQFDLQITPKLLSDYRSSGISQTLGDPALQLDVLLAHASGLYAGVWSSNVEYGYDWEQDDDYGTRQEVDYYAGYYWQIDDDLSLDLYYNSYSYPGEGQFNGADVYLTLDAYGFFIGGKHSADVDESSSSYFAGYRTQLPLEIGLELKAENVDYKDKVFFNKDWIRGQEDYNNWSIGLQREMLGVNWGASYVDTDLSQAECMSYMGYDDLCSATLVFSASQTF